jgi:hypothetical protein
MMWLLEGADETATYQRRQQEPIFDSDSDTRPVDLQSACQRGQWFAVTTILSQLLSPSGDGAAAAARDAAPKAADISINVILENEFYKQQTFMRAVKQEMLPLVERLAGTGMSLDFQDKVNHFKLFTWIAFYIWVLLFGRRKVKHRC